MRRYTPEDWKVHVTSIHKHLNREKRYDPKFNPRAFMIECLGVPSSGKSGAAHFLYKFLALVDLRVRKFQEPGERFNKPRTNPGINFRAAWETLDLMHKIEESISCDVAIIEKGIFDAYCWANYWRRKGVLTPAECAEFQNVITSSLWTNMVDIVFCFSCEPKVTLKRNAATTLIKKEGETINKKGSSLVAEAYQESIRELAEKFPEKVIVIETDKLSPAKVGRIVCRKTMEMLKNISEKKYAENFSV